MFGSNFNIGFVGGAENHLAQEREPPARPTNLEFPRYVPLFQSGPLSSKLSSKLRHKLCHSRLPTDTSDEDLAKLNIKLDQDVSLSEFVPAGQFSSRPFLYDDDLDAMLAEISLDNAVAFREVLRMPPLPGTTKPRIAYARNFFGNLEDMARYFDASQDNYYRVPLKGPEAKAGPDHNTAAPKDGTKTASNTSDSTMTPSAAESLMNIEVDDNVVETHKADASPKSHTQCDSTSTQPETKEVYKGYRLGSGESMSPGTRIALVRNFLKILQHKFHLRDHEPIPLPREKFSLRGVKVGSIQYHFCLAKAPTERELARSRMVIGPIMAVHSREELRFKEKTGLHNPEKTGFVGERFDLLREVGNLLILARQRARAETDQPINDPMVKWWTTEQRWGGGPVRWGQMPHEVFEEEDPSWSPEERQLQAEKRRRETESKTKPSSTEEALDARKLEVDDLMAQVGDKPLPGKSTGPASSPSPLPLPSSFPLSSSTPTNLAMALADLRPRKKKLRSMDRPPGNEPEMKDGKRLAYTPAFKQRWYADWQRLRPNSSSHDEKIIPKYIGREDASTGWDEVYGVSAVNHHLCLLKMRVHKSYLSWLEDGIDVPDPNSNSTAESETPGLKQNVLYIQRSKWFDMLDVEARRDFLTGLWRLMCWINRDEVPREEYDKMEEKRKLQQQQQHQQQQASASSCEE